jgi:hypothetical protein
VGQRGHFEGIRKGLRLLVASVTLFDDPVERSNRPLVKAIIQTEAMKARRGLDFQCESGFPSA